MREYVKKRKALKKGANIADFTNEQWEALKDKYRYCCFYCGNKPDRLEQDHVIPLSRGGDHTKSNIVPACPFCNNSKNNKTLEEYLSLVGCENAV